MSSTPTAFIPSFGNDSPTCIPTRRLSRAACPNTAQCGYYWLFRTNLSFSARFPPLLWLASPFSHLLRFKMFASSSVVPSHTIPHLSYFLTPSPSLSPFFSHLLIQPISEIHATHLDWGSMSFQCLPCQLILPSAFVTSGQINLYSKTLVPL